MKNRYPQFVIITICLFFYLLTSCVDRGLDFRKDIDLTIHIGGSAFSLPIGNTDSIKLSNIIKLNEKNVLCLKGGEYYLSKRDSVAPIKVNISDTPPINVNPLFFPNLPVLPKGRNPLSEVSIPSIGIPFEFKYKSMPVEVLSLKTISFPKTSLSRITIKFNVIGVTPDADIRTKDFRIAFPKFIVSDDLNANNEFVMLNDRLYSGYTKEIIMKTLDFSGEVGGNLPINNQILDIAKDINILGKLSMINLLPSKVLGDVKIGISFFIDPIQITKIQGQVNPTIDVNVKPISFDIPSFLKDDAVVLDVLDPSICLNIKNGTEIPVVLKGKLQGFRRNVMVSEVVVEGSADNPIVIDPNGQTVISLSRTGKAGVVGSKKYQIADLNKLITKIPDKVNFVMTASADQRVKHTIELGKNYAVDINYAVEVPFSFGPGLSIVYNDTIDGFNHSIKTIEAQKVNVTVNVENNIPLLLGMEAIPVGVNKDQGPLAGITVTVDRDIQPCDKDGKSQDSPILIELNESIPGAMRKLDGLLIKVTAKSTQTINGMPLKENQYVRLKDIKAKAFGGMSLDLN